MQHYLGKLTAHAGDSHKWDITEIIMLDLKELGSKCILSCTYLTMVRNSPLVIGIHIPEQHLVIALVD